MDRLNNLYEQITPKTTPEELSEKIMNRKAVKMTPKKRPSKAVAAILAATVSVSALTLTAGAVNGWDYAGMFRSIFGEEKTENIMENIVPEATVLQDTIDIMDFELVAAAADNHGVLAILDVYPENGYKLLEEVDGQTIIKPFGDLFICIDSGGIFGSGVGVDVLEQSDEKVRLGVRMNTEDEIKDKKCTLIARLQNKKNENGEYEFDINADYSWHAEFVADYSAEEISYEKEMDLSGTDYEGKLIYSRVKKIEVSPISVYFEGENFDKYFDTIWCAEERYILLDSGEKVRITDIYSSGYNENDPLGSTMLSLCYEEPVNPEEVCAVILGGETIEIK